MTALSLFTFIFHYFHEDSSYSSADDVIRSRKIVLMGRNSKRDKFLMSVLNNDNNDHGNDDDHKEEEEEEARELERKMKNFNAKRSLEKLVLNDPVYKRRSATAYNNCLKRPIARTEEIVTDTWKKSALCLIPKVAITTWTNIYRFINNDTGNVHYERPQDIPRWLTHTLPMKNRYYLYPSSDLNTPYFNNTSFLSDSFRFMFVRHPIRRLWSAWVDKFLLPDFWFSEGPAVFKLLNINVEEATCPSNITFEQFLRYVTHGQFARRPHSANYHWIPYRFICDPCLFRPHLIGKMETFGQDATTALSVMNVDSYLKNKKHRRTNGSGTTNKDCGITQLFVAERLWKAFQINGHIRHDIEFPMKHWSMDGWHQALRQAYTQWHPDQGTRKSQQSKQKDRALYLAYNRIPLTIILNIHAVFKHDFAQFGYDFNP